MLKLVLFAHLLLIFLPSHAAPPQDALAAFDGLCVGTGADLSTIEKMATAAGAKPVPPEVLNHDPVIATSGGKGFAFNRNGSRFIVTATPTGTCSMLLFGIKAPAMRSLVEANYSLAKPHIESSGTQVNTLFRITAPSMYAGGYLMIGEPKPGFGADNLVTLGFIPASAAAKLRIGQR